MTTREQIKNRVLLSLPQDEFSQIAPLLERASMRVHENLIRPNLAVSHIYFPDSGLISVLIGRDSCAEIALIGAESMSPMVLLPGDRMPFTLVVQIRGEASRMRSEDFALAVISSPRLRMLAQRCNQSLLIQASFTALSHAAWRIPQRLARWLLMAQDRVGLEEIPVVHQCLALMLSVRRSGVTEALHMLERAGAIRIGRAKITILDRAPLERIAGSSYGGAEAEHRRLLGL